MIRLAVLLVTLSLAIPARGAVRGHVLDTSGKPVEGASVAAFVPETTFGAMQRHVERRERVPIMKTSTSPEGSFALEIDDGTPLALVITAEKHAPQQLSIIAGPDGITVALARCAMFKGQVTANGKPVADARVVWIGNGLTFGVATQADGTYEVPDPKGWAWGALVLHPDHAAEQVGSRGEDFPATVALTAGKSVRGVVLHDGEPVAGAVVRAGVLPLGRSGADGTFVVPHLPATLEQIQAHAGALSGKARVSTQPLRIDMTTGLTMYGTVRDDKGRPLPGTLIETYSHDALLETFADARGHYELGGVSVEGYVSATRPGYRRVETSDDDQEPARAEKRRRFDITMKPEVLVRGRVVDEAGEAVAGAALTYLPATFPSVYGARYFGSAYSGADGRFALSEAPQHDGNDKLQTVALKEGYVVARVDPAEQRGAAGRELTIRLRKAIPVSGVVADDQGHPIAGAGVVALRFAAGPNPRFTPESFLDGADPSHLQPTDEKGRFTLFLDSGEHTIGARAEGLAPATATIDVRPGAGPVTLKLAKGLTLEGRVLRHDGSPVAGAFVQLGEQALSMSAETDSSGGFRFGGLKEGAYAVTVVFPGEELFERRDVALPAAPLTIRAARTVTIAGRVRSNRDGRPVTRFTVSAQPQDDMPMMRGFGSMLEPRDFENAEGSFSIAGVAPGSYTVTTRAEGFAPDETTLHVEADAEKEPEPLAIALNPAARFYGRITSGGEPLADVNVRVRGDYSTYGADALKSDLRGEFELSNIAAGEVTLEFERDGYVARQESVVVRDDGALHEFTMNRARRLKGLVVSDAGEPLGGARISARSQEDDSGDYTSSDESGIFVLRSLSSGKQTIEVSRSGYADLTLRDVQASQEPPLRIVMKKLQTGSVAGTIRGQSAGSQVMISASPEGSREVAGTIDASGGYRIDEVPAGRVAVAVFIGSETASRTLTKSVDVPRSAEARLDFDLEVSRRIDGRVTLGGEPLVNAQVSFEAGSGTSASAHTRAGGAYSAEVSRDGPHTVSVWSAQLGSSYRTAYTVRGSGTFDIDIRLRRFAGRVLDTATGAPLPRASVTLVALDLPHEGDASTTCDSSGRFAIATAAAGPVRLRASHDGYGQRFAEFTSDSSSDVVLELSRSDGLAVRLIDARNGKPLGGTIVLRDGAGRYAFNKYTDKKTDGSIQVAVAPGQYTLSASSTGYSTQSLPVTVPSSEVRIGLTPGGTLVVTSPNESVRMAKLVMPNGAEYIRCECNGIAELKITGSLTRIDNVAPGAYRLVVYSDGGSSSYALQITEGGITTIAVD